MFQEPAVFLIPTGGQPQFIKVVGTKPNLAGGSLVTLNGGGGSSNGGQQPLHQQHTKTIYRTLATTQEQVYRTLAHTGAGIQDWPPHRSRYTGLANTKEQVYRTLDTTQQ